MIESSWVGKNPKSGIYYIGVNTTDRWVEYQINRVTEKGKIEISFYTVTSIEYMYGQWEDEETESIEFIEIEEDFNPHNYMITSMQEKDQIILVAIPAEHTINREFFELIRHD